MRLTQVLWFLFVNTIFLAALRRPPEAARTIARVNGYRASQVVADAFINSRSLCAT